MAPPIGFRKLFGESHAASLDGEVRVALPIGPRGFGCVAQLPHWQRDFGGLAGSETIGLFGLERGHIRYRVSLAILCLAEELLVE